MLDQNSNKKNPRSTTLVSNFKIKFYPNTTFQQVSIVKAIPIKNQDLSIYDLQKKVSANESFIYIKLTVSDNMMA